MDYVQVAYSVSDRRACEVLTLLRASHRHHSVAGEQVARSRFPCLGMGVSRSFVGLSHISWDPLACRSNLQPSRFTAFTLPILRLTEY